jgi:hypothetical protein
MKRNRDKKTELEWKTDSIRKMVLKCGWMETSMNAEIEKCLEALRSRNMHGMFCEDAKAATSEILKLIPQGAVVGIGDSTAVRQTGVLEASVC